MANIPVFFTADLAAVAGVAGVIESLTEAPEPAVVVASAPACAGVPVPLDGNRVLVVLGEAPHGLRPFLSLPAEPSSGHLDSAVAAARVALENAMEVERLRRTLTAHRALERELLEIGTALSAENDLRRLLDRILTSARTLVNADAGSLYLVDQGGGEEPRLRFVLAQNASREMAWSEVTLAIDHSSIAGMVASTANPLRIDDAYTLPEDSPFGFNRSFDEETGYRSRSLLAVPMLTRAGELVGVVQLLNRKRDPEALLRTEDDVERLVLPFTSQDEDLLRALASQAAVALENTRLVEEIQALFESFVRASVTAIEQRDPPTSGHSFRVAGYTIGLAQALEKTPPPSYRGIRFSRDEVRQLRYAALLHDVGKVGVREAVLTKARKLYPYQELLVRERFERARHALKLERTRALIEDLTRRGTTPSAGNLERLSEELLAIDAELDDALEVIDRAGRPNITDREVTRVLEEIGRRQFPGRHGEPVRLLQQEELHFLHLSRGNLDEREREEIQSHVVHSFQFLNTLPWPSHLRRVPEIAALHHEKLNGHGYPSRVSAPDIPVEVRMLTISDIYDALTAGDRPYKRSVDSTRALEILEQEVREGALDAALFRVFVEAQVYRYPAAPPPA
ncbi:MAG: GAF domain-containing protein [Acidobacteria bacterium]|nr:GAF domain-containing protein [Acidobacteriota bacterium]